MPQREKNIIIFPIIELKKIEKTIKVSSPKINEISICTVQAWPQDRSGRSPTLEQGPMGALGAQGAKIARVPWADPGGP